MNRFYSLVLALLVGLTPLGCGGDGANSLDGSIKTLLDIGFEEVQIKLFGDAVRIQFVKAFGATTEDDVVAEITVSTLNSELTTKTEIPFVGNATLDRLIHKLSNNGVLIEDETQEFPPVFDGFIFFNELSTETGDNISGRFSVTFNSGLVLSGKFSGPLELDESAS